MSAPKVSIIIPVYKAETTLRKCLDSIVNQTLKEWEAILVDDGSPDSSGMICDEYVTKDNRFRVIHKTNMGVAMARQAGIDVAQGKYVIHVDADDWVESSMLQELYRNAEENDADVVLCDYFSNLAHSERLIVQQPPDLTPKTILYKMFHGLHGSLCNKLVKRDCYSQYNLHFYEKINYSEDKLIWAQLLRHEEVKVSYLPKAFYHYVHQTTSLTNNYTLETLNENKRFISVLETLLPEDSDPVITSKEDAKKMAYRNGVLGNSEFKELYPEIKSTRSDKVMVTLMYHFAFNGHFFLANLLRKAYKVFNHQ